MKESNIQNYFYIDSLNQPLIQDNRINNDNNSSTHSSNKVSLPENNLSFDFIKSNPDANKEMYMLNTRNDFTTRIEGL